MVAIVTVALLGGLLTGICGPCIRALLLAVNAPETRGSVVALLPFLRLPPGRGAMALFLPLSTATSQPRLPLLLFLPLPVRLLEKGWPRAFSLHLLHFCPAALS